MKTYPILDLQATGNRIKKIRTEKQISVTDICRYMGFENPQAVYKWQRGEALPTVDNLFALSRLLETSIENILCVKEEAAAAASSVVSSVFSLYLRLRRFQLGEVHFRPI